MWHPDNLEHNEKFNLRNFNYDPANPVHRIFEVELLETLEFDNDRKRMSVILKIPAEWMNLEKKKSTNDNFQTKNNPWYDDFLLSIKYEPEWATDM